MKNYFITVVVLLSALGIAGALVVQAQEETITFPVEELGGCEDEATCRAFCDKPGNISACIAFAKKNKLMDEDEAAQAEKFAAAMESGNTPGGCTSEASCHAYCENVKNIEECLTFAGDNGMMDPAEREEALKVAAALKGGAELPAGCTSKQSCEKVCRGPENMKACILFAKTAGLMSGQELEEAEKMLAAIERGVTPPPCGGKEECDEYCGQEENFGICLEFAEAAGFIKPEEAAMARKTGGKGPGGCKRDECKTFCDNPENQEACTTFAIENNLMSADDLQRMNEGKEKMKEGLGQAPAEVQECLKAAIGEEKLNQIMSGTGFPTQAIGEKMRSCFDQFSGQMGPPPGNDSQRGGPQPGYEGSGEQYGPPPGYEGQMPPQGGEYSPPPGYEGQMPPEGYQRPPEGSFEQYKDQMPPASTRFGEAGPEYQQQYQEQYQEQYQQQYEQRQQEYQEQYQGAPDGGSYPPPSGDSYAPPPSESTPPPPPPPAESAPTSVRYSAVRDMASMLWVFLGMFQ